MNIPTPTLAHLQHMTDSVGLFEHAQGSQPRLDHGYCSDDAGRAIVVTCRSSDPRAASLTNKYVDFLTRMHLHDGRFALRLGVDGDFKDLDTSDDACGRAILGLGFAASHASDAHVRDWAGALFSHAAGFRSPWLRAMAYAGVGAAAVLETRPHDPNAQSLLAAAASAIADATNTRVWPEDRLTYANALLPECLLAAGHHLHDVRFRQLGLQLLDWLVRHETNAAGNFSFTPVGGRDLNDTRTGFDQQPIEASAIADAAARAYDMTGDEYWSGAALQAARWFQGANDGATVMHDRTTDGGYDGLCANGPNTNQGAESTIAMLNTFERARWVSLRVPSARPFSELSVR
jgi:hypothetical protein